MRQINGLLLKYILSCDKIILYAKNAPEVSMKSIKSFIFEGCAYTVILCFFLYFFLAITGVGASGVPFLKFLLVFAYGFLIPLAGIIRNAFKANPIPSFILHYAILLAGFIAVYMLNASSSAALAGNVFVAIFIFSFIYAAYYGIKTVIRHIRGKQTKPRKKAKKENKPKEDTYTPRFGG
jgi:hypothetical protein